MIFSLPFPFGGFTYLQRVQWCGYADVVTKTPNKFFMLILIPALRFGSGIGLGYELGFVLGFGLDFGLGSGLDFEFGFGNCSLWNLLLMWNLWT